MKKNPISKKKSTSFLYLKYFVVGVVILVVGAILLRTVNLARNSTFTDDYYAVLIQGENPFLLQIDTTQKAISQVTYTQEVNSVKNPEEASFILMTPVNAIIKFRSIEKSSGYMPNSFFAFSSFFSHFSRNNIYEYKNINQYDIGKIFFLGKYSTLKTHDLTVKKIFTNEELSSSYQEFIEEHLRDKVVLNEKVPVEVINASGQNGVGARLAKVLSLHGFNVVSVSSTRTPIAGSTLTIRTLENTTTKRVKEIFPISVVTSRDSHVADISVVVGQDYVGKKLDIK